MVNKKSFDLLDALEKVIPRKTAEDLISYIDSEHEQKIVREVERRMEHLATKKDIWATKEEIWAAKKEMKEEIKREVERLEAKIDTKINRIENKMNTQFYWLMGGIISILIAFIFK